MLSYKTFKVVFRFTFLFGKCKKFEVNCRRDGAEKVVGLLARYITVINKIKLIVTIETNVALTTRNNKNIAKLKHECPLSVVGPHAGVIDSCRRRKTVDQK